MNVCTMSMSVSESEVLLKDFPPGRPILEEAHNAHSLPNTGSLCLVYTKHLPLSGVHIE